MELSFHLQDKESRTVQAGTTLSGKLCISATKTTPAKELALYFKGKEYTSVVHKGQLSHDQHLILRLDLNVPEEIIQGDHVKAGSYEVPFSFDVPAHVPPSLEVTQHKGIRKESASVVYRLRAVLLGSGKVKDYTAQQEIQVVRAPKKPAPAIVAPHIAPPHTHVLPKNRGEIMCGVKILDAQVLPGQKPQIQLSIVNDSTATVQTVELVLQQELSWWAANNKPVGSPFHSTSTTQTLCEQTISLDASTKLDADTVQQRLQDPHRHHANKQQIQHELAQGSDSNPVYTSTLPPVPPSITTSFQGQKIGVVHQMAITLVTDGKHRLSQLVPVQLLPGQLHA